MKMIYTLGYTGLNMEAIKAKVEALDAYLIDIRLMPFSRVPVWRGANFAKELKDRYIHAKSMGNVNYKGGPMLIQSIADGIRLVGKILPHNNVVLMCACADHTTCHRSVVADLLNDALGADVTHLAKGDIMPDDGKPKGKKQSNQPLSLF